MADKATEKDVPKAVEKPDAPFKFKHQMKLSEADFILNMSGQASNEWLAKLPSGTDPESILDPVFWSHVAKKMRPMDKIDAWAIDGSFYGEYIVLYAEGLAANIKQLRLYKLDDYAGPDTGAEIFVVKWISPPCGFGVVRKADGERVKEGFKTKAAAGLWMQSQLKALKK